MAEADQLVSTVKKHLKSQGKTYREVAQALGLSEPSVKRLFATGTFSVERMVQVANLLGYTLAELAQEAQAAQPRLSTLSEAQEREIVSDPRLLIVTVCALNHWEIGDITRAYRIEHAECIKYLLQLDRLGIIELLPGNRIRLNITRDFDWLPEGPIRQYFREKMMGDFLRGEFNEEGEVLGFVHGMMSEQALVQVHAELKRLRKRFAELHEESLVAPMEKRTGMAMLYALRSWEPEDFVQLRRAG